MPETGVGVAALPVMIHVSGMRPARRHDDAKFEHGWRRNHRNATATGRRLAPNSGRQPDRRGVAWRGAARLRDADRRGRMLYWHRHVHQPPRMRRVLVIFLILLFPLNVFALSMSAASLPAALQQAEVPGHVLAADVGGADTDTDIDIDPDEPPAGADLHYIVCRGGALQFAAPAAAAPALHDPAPPSHAIPPPVKPPRAA